VYSSNFLSDDEAAATLLANLDGAPLAEPKPLRFKAGRRRKFWDKNCVTMGLASGFLEPLESQSIHLIQVSISNFMTLFPDRHCAQAEIDRYNRIMTFEFEKVRDFIVLHYKATERDDSPFWDYCRTMSVPDYLADKMRLFEEHGRIFRENLELFNDTSWFAVMMGQGLRPRGYDPMVDIMEPDELRRRLANIHSTIERSVDVMPEHWDFIAQNCSSEPMTKVAAPG
jgi:tryptophan halogenase